MCAIHDLLVARWLHSNAGEIDVVHVWPSAALQTIREAKRHGIPILAERPNTHTAYAYEAAAEESRSMGIELPENHDHQFNRKTLAMEELEYLEVDILLCPSEFVAKTFLERGYPEAKLFRHHYGFDESRCGPGSQDAREIRGLTALYAGVCEPRKGLHYALRAWLGSGAQERGSFLIAGAFVPGYQEKLETMLSHPSVKVLGHRSDLPELMRRSDVFILSSVEEGSALVTYEARGCGCVLLVSNASGAICRHEHDGLVHRLKDVASLTDHIKRVDKDRALLERLRKASLDTVSALTWTAAGSRLLAGYQHAASMVKRNTLGE